MPTHYGVINPVPARRPAPAAEVSADIPAHVHPVDVPAVEATAVRWVVKGTDRTVNHPSQVDIVRGNVVRAVEAPAVEATIVDLACEVPATGDGAAPAGDQVDTVPAAPANREGSIMRATVNRADLVDALTYVNKGIPSRPSVPALAGIVLAVAGDTLTVHSFDWDTYRAGDVPATDAGAGRVAVSGARLLTAVKSLDKASKIVTLAGAGETLTLSDGTEEINFPTMPVEDMPNVPTEAHVIGTIDAGTLGTLAGAVAGAAGTDDVEPIMAMVRVRTKGDKIDFTATDRYRLHTAAGTWSPASDDAGYLVAPGSEYPVPAKILSAVASLFVKRATVTVKGRKVVRPASVTVTAGIVKVHESMSPAPFYGLACDGYRVLTSAYDSKPYPPVDTLFPASPAGTVTVDRVALVDMIGKVSASGTRARHGNVILKFSAESVTAEYWDDDCDGAPARTRTMPATVSGKLPAEACFNPFYLVDALAPFPGDTVTLALVDAQRPVVLTSDGAAGMRNLLMPIRIAGRDAEAPAAAVPAAEAPAPAVESGDQGDAVTAGTVAVEAPARESLPFTLPASLVASYWALTDAGNSAGYAVKTLWVPAGAEQTPKGEWTKQDSVSLQIGTPDNWNTPYQKGKSHVVVSWDSWTDRVRVQPGANLHTVEQVTRYLAGYRDAVAGATFGADGLERAYREVTGLNPYAESLPRRPFSAPAPDDFTPYADEIEGCGCPLCLVLVAGIDGEHADTDAARALLSALADGSHVRTVSPAVVPAAEAPAPAVESVDQDDAVTDDRGDAEAPAGEFDAMVREMIAGATWSFGTGYIGGGKRRRGTRFNGPIMQPALPDRRLSREEWSALADMVHALGGGRWMSDVKGFACQSGDVGTPWTKPTRSTQARAAEYLAETAAPAVVPAAEAPAVPATKPRQRDPRKVLTAVLRKLRANPGTEVHVTVNESTAVVSCKGARPTDDQVSEAFGERYMFAGETPGIVGTYYRFTPVRVRPDVLPAPAASTVLTYASTGEAYGAVNCDDTVPDGAILNVPSERVIGVATGAWPIAVTAERGEFHSGRWDTPELDHYRPSIDAAVSLALAGTSIGYALADGLAGEQLAESPAMAAEAPAMVAGEQGDAVTVTLVYADDAPAGAQLAESPAGEAADQGDASSVTTHGAHAQRIHVTGLGELDGFRFHLVAGVGARAFRKVVGSALLAHAGEFGARFAVTTPAGAHAVNVAARPGESVADWSPVLALVASILGDAVDTSGAECAACDRSRALAEI